MAILPFVSWLVHRRVYITHKIVQEAIKQLRERGEKVTAFVVIAVAKQVVKLWLFDLLRILSLILNNLIWKVTGLSLLILWLSGMFH